MDLTQWQSRDRVRGAMRDESWEEMEAMRRDLASRRVILEQKSRIRESTEVHCATIRAQSFERRKEMYKEQLEAARQRNMKILQEVRQASALGISSSSSSSSALGSTSAMSLKRAKERFIQVIEKELPVWEEQMVEAYVAQMERMERERIKANRRRETANKVYKEEQVMRKVLEQKRQEVRELHLQERNEEVERAMARESLNQEVAEANRSMMSRGMAADAWERYSSPSHEPPGVEELIPENLSPTPGSSYDIQSRSKQGAKEDSKRQAAELARKQATWSSEQIALGASEAARTSRSSQKDVAFLQSVLDSSPFSAPSSSLPPVHPIRYVHTTTFSSQSFLEQQHQGEEQEEEEQQLVGQTRGQPVGRIKSQGQDMDEKRKGPQHQPVHQDLPTAAISSSATAPLQPSMIPIGKPAEEKQEEESLLPPPSQSSLSSGSIATDKNQILVQSGKGRGDRKSGIVEENQAQSQNHPAAFVMIQEEVQSGPNVTDMNMEEKLLVAQALCAEIERVKGRSRHGYPTQWNGQTSSSTLAYEREIYHSLKSKGSKSFLLPTKKSTGSRPREEIMCPSFLRLVRCSARDLVPLELLNGLVDEEKVSKYHRRVVQQPPSSSASELWNTVCRHLRQLLDSKVLTQEELISVFSEAFVGDNTGTKERSEVNRIRRKVAALLESIAINALESSNQEPISSRSSSNTTNKKEGQQKQQQSLLMPPSQQHQQQHQQVQQQQQPVQTSIPSQKQQQQQQQHHKEQQLLLPLEKQQQHMQKQQHQQSSLSNPSSPQQQPPLPQPSPPLITGPGSISVASSGVAGIMLSGSKGQQQTQEQQQQQTHSSAPPLPQPPAPLITRAGSISITSNGAAGIMLFGTKGRSSSKKKLILSHSASLIHSGSVQKLGDLAGDEIAELDELVGSRSQQGN